jgi:hypothetical protein
VGWLGYDVEDFAGHTLRAGLATSAAAAGKSERAIMNQTVTVRCLQSAAISVTGICSATTRLTDWGCDLPMIYKSMEEFTLSVTACIDDNPH